MTTAATTTTTTVFLSLTLGSTQVSAASSRADDNSLFTSLAALMKSASSQNSNNDRTASEYSKDWYSQHDEYEYEYDDIWPFRHRHEDENCNNDDENYDKDIDFTSTRRFLHRQIKEVIPSLAADVWKQGQEYGWDVLQLVRRRSNSRIQSRIQSHGRRIQSFWDDQFPQLDDASNNHNKETSNRTYQHESTTTSLPFSSSLSSSSELLSEHENEMDMMKESSWLDIAAHSLVISVAWITAWQSLVTWFSNQQVFDEFASRWLGTESTAAIKTIGNILSNAQEDHGFVDVMGKYPPAEVAASMFALSRLQQAAALYNKNRANNNNYNNSSNNNNETTTFDSDNHHVDTDDDDAGNVDDSLLQDLAHYAKFATAAYGWKMDLAFSGRLHWGGDAQALLKMTGVAPEHVVSMQWQSKTHRPAYFIVREMDRKRIVLCIRGTWSLRDILTDLCCTAEEFETSGGGGGGDKNNRSHRTYRAHHGMLEAARAVASTAQEIIMTELHAHPDFSLVLVGHSMGGGVAALLGLLWEDVVWPKRKIDVYVYGAPCVSPLEPSLGSATTRAAAAAAGATDVANGGGGGGITIVSVVTEGDPMCALSLGHVADLSIAVSQLCEQPDLRQEIMRKTNNDLSKRKEADDEDNNLQWCSETLSSSLHQVMNSDRLYPPGRILFLSKIHHDETGAVQQRRQRRRRQGKTNSRIAVRSVPPDFFRDLLISPRMFDLSQHAPARYESWLRRLVQQKLASITTTA